MSNYRTPKQSPSDKQYLKLSSLRKSSSTLASDLKKKSPGVSVHPFTVRRQLNTMGLKECVAVKKPLLRKGNLPPTSQTELCGKISSRFL